MGLPYSKLYTKRNPCIQNQVHETRPSLVAIPIMLQTLQNLLNHFHQKKIDVMQTFFVLINDHQIQKALCELDNKKSDYFLSMQRPSFSQLNAASVRDTASVKSTGDLW